MSTTTDISTDGKSISMTATRTDLNMNSDLHDVNIRSLKDVEITSTDNNIILDAKRCVNITSNNKSVNLNAPNGKINLNATNDIKLESTNGSIVIKSDRDELITSSHRDMNTVSEWGDITIDALNGTVNIKSQKNINITPGPTGNVNVNGNINAVSVTQGPINSDSNTQIVDSSGNVNSPSGLLVPTGSVIPYCGTSNPAGWFICNGATYNKIIYDKLFSAIGYTFGGSGEFFAVPDLRGRVVVGSASDASGITNKNVGDLGGSETHTLTEDEMPAHTHTVNTDISGWTSSAYNVAGAPDRPDRGSNSTTTSSAGGSQPHNIMQPYLTLNYIIKY